MNPESPVSSPNTQDAAALPLEGSLPGDRRGAALLNVLVDSSASTAIRLTALEHISTNSALLPESFQSIVSVATEERGPNELRVMAVKVLTNIGGSEALSVLQVLASSLLSNPRMLRAHPELNKLAAEALSGVFSTGGERAISDLRRSMHSVSDLLRLPGFASSELGQAAVIHFGDEFLATFNSEPSVSMFKYLLPGHGATIVASLRKMIEHPPSQNQFFGALEVLWELPEGQAGQICDHWNLDAALASAENFDLLLRFASTELLRKLSSERGALVPIQVLEISTEEGSQEAVITLAGLKRSEKGEVSRAATEALQRLAKLERISSHGVYLIEKAEQALRSE